MIEHRERSEGRDVVAELRTAAASHEPDRIRMLARVTAGMAADGRSRGARTGPRRPRATRLVGPVAGLAAAVAATGIAVVATDGAERPQTVRTSSEPPAPPAGAGAERRPGEEPGAGSQSDAERHTPSAYPTAAGPNHLAEPTVRSKGAINAHSNPYWAQSDITLTIGRPLTSLTVELRVADTGDVLSTGSWSSLPTGDVATATRVEDGVLVYRWTLRKGATVRPGRYVFAGQYNHAEGDRDTGRDAYSASGNGASGAFAVRGDFPRFTAGD
ncbi:hypothetical protein ACIQPP_32720 [Streptomyces violaceusniger]|uniref:hypothetical protein n=1 Tax=Streptomyces violaceusniger TaxID=68280 RepID=UPI000997AD02|nr:hypothetical protein [Streptomyces hygroscopicus]AQW49962.1 hypothetical protein SHXM_03425 [Streptomyces hygroscopicus]